MYIMYLFNGNLLPSFFLIINPHLGLWRVAVLLYDRAFGLALRFTVSQSSVNNRHGLSAGRS